MKPARYELTLEAPASDDHDAATMRLRHFLKRAWRAYALRCVSATEATDTTTTTEPKGNPSC